LSKGSGTRGEYTTDTESKRAAGEALRVEERPDHELLDTLKNINKQLQDTRFENNRLREEIAQLKAEATKHKNKIKTQETRQKYAKKRMNNAIDVLIALASLDFEKVAEVTDNEDEFDGLATGLNMLRQELKASTVSVNYFDDIFRSMNDILTVVDPTGTIETCNQTGESVLGNDVLGKKIWEILQNGDDGDLLTASGIKAIIEDDMPRQAELNVRTVNGDLLPVEVLISPMNSREGLVVTARNIQERKEAEILQNELVRSLEESNNELRQFAYVTSHDLKAPLRGISMLSQWILEDSGEVLSEDSKANLELLTGRVKRMYGFLEGVLAYSKIGLNKDAVFEIELNSLVMEIIDSIDVPKSVNINLDSTLPTVNAAKTHMIQVFQNLISNAIKYNDKEDGEIIVGMQESNDNRLFYVKDNGIGIDKAHFDKIFVIFQTLKPRDTVESTGIGLTIVKKIVEYYGGEIWLESEIKKGTTFYFTLPV